MIKGPFYFDFAGEPTAPSAGQARFQERQSEAREQKLAEMLETQSHRGPVASGTYRLSPAGSATSTNSIASSISEISSLEESLRVGGRVRQMFEERRKNGGGPLPVPTGWENQSNQQTNGRTASSKSDPLSEGRGRVTGNNPTRGRPRFNAHQPPPAPPRNPSKGKRSSPAADGKSRMPRQTVTTIRRSRSTHRLENDLHLDLVDAGVNGDATISSPASLNPATGYGQRGVATGIRSSSQPPRRRNPARDVNGNAEALAILDGAELPTQDKELLKQMFVEERRRLQDEMERREQALMARIKEQEDQLRRLSNSGDARNGVGEGGPAVNKRASPQGGGKKPARNVTRVIKRAPADVPSPAARAANDHDDSAQFGNEAANTKAAKANAAATRRAYKPPKPKTASTNATTAPKNRPSPPPPPASTSPPAKEKEEKAPAPRAPPPPGMGSCSICGRNFNLDRLEKHEGICEKTATKKRKKFDSSKFRNAGIEGEGGLPPATKSNTKGKGGKGGKAASQQAASQASGGSGEPKKKDWRAKREEFLEAMRDAKKVQKHLAAGGKLEDLPPPKPMDNSDYIQCPHCGRKFAEGAAERHIPKCANIKSNKPR